MDLQEHVESGCRQRFESVARGVEELQIGRLVRAIAQPLMYVLVPFVHGPLPKRREDLLEGSKAGAGDVGHCGQVEQQITRAGSDGFSALLSELISKDGIKVALPEDGRGAGGGRGERW